MSKQFLVVRCNKSLEVGMKQPEVNCFFLIVLLVSSGVYCWNPILSMALVDYFILRHSFHLGFSSKQLLETRSN